VVCEALLMGHRDILSWAFPDRKRPGDHARPL
jgi:hypothetical protein